MSSKLFEGADHAQLYKTYRSSIPEHAVCKTFQYLQEKVHGPFHHIVDVGCGSGQGSEFFAPQFEKYTGVDTSEAQITQAIQSNKYSNAKFFVANAEKLPFPDNSITLINVHVALHWFNIPQFFKEVNRILVTDGVIAISGAYIPTPSSENGDSARMAFLFNETIWNEILLPYQHPSLIKCNFDKIYNPEKTDYPFKDLMKLNLPYTRRVLLKCLFRYISTWSAYQKFQKADPETLQGHMRKWKAEFLTAFGAQSIEEDYINISFNDFFLILGRKANE